MYDRHTYSGSLCALASIIRLPVEWNNVNYSKLLAMPHSIAFVNSSKGRSCVTCTDEKEKYDPSSFRDSIVQGLTEAQGDIEQVGPVAVNLTVCSV